MQNSVDILELDVLIQVVKLLRIRLPDVSLHLDNLIRWKIDKHREECTGATLKPVVRKTMLDRILRVTEVDDLVSKSFRP